RMDDAYCAADHSRAPEADVIADRRFALCLAGTTDPRPVLGILLPDRGAGPAADLVLWLDTPFRHCGHHWQFASPGHHFGAEAYGIPSGKAAGSPEACDPDARIRR